MKLTRRQFLKSTGVSACALMLPSEIEPSDRAPALPAKGMLVDITKCVGCGWCQQACQESNSLASSQSQESAIGLSADNWTVVIPKETEACAEQRPVYVKRQCMHCIHPACASACPVGALHRTDQGAIVYDGSRCIGCRYCMVACPFGVPKLEWDERFPYIRKCTFCTDRLQSDLSPACAEACPTGAILFGERTSLVSVAQERIRSDPSRYIDHIYGLTELGGTAWMYLSPLSFSQLGFPNLGDTPVTALSEAVATYGTPALAASVAALLSGIYHRFSSKGPRNSQGDGGLNTGEKG